MMQITAYYTVADMNIYYAVSPYLTPPLHTTQIFPQIWTVAMTGPDRGWGHVPPSMSLLCTLLQ